MSGAVESPEVRAAREALGNVDSPQCRAHYGEDVGTADADVCTLRLGHDGDHGPCDKWAREPERTWLRAVLAALDESTATIANERGEGEPPSVGWRATSTGHWSRGDVGDSANPYAGASKGSAAIGSGAWEWSTRGRQGHAPTAREAMRAADKVTP